MFRVPSPSYFSTPKLQYLILCERGADHWQEFIVFSGLERDASQVAIGVKRGHDFSDLRGYLSLSFENNVSNQPYIRHRQRSVLVKRDDARARVGRGKGHAVRGVREAFFQRESVDFDFGITIRIRAQ
jgi:hypothetical protein